MDIYANLIYFLWDAYRALIEGNAALFINKFTLKSLAKLLLLNESPLSGHLWYLNAILYVLVIVKFADKFKCRRVLYFLTPLLLLGDLVFGKYSVLILDRKFPYILVRNFLFVGLPYFCIGRLIRNGMGQKTEKNVLGCLIVVYSLTTALEKLFLVHIGKEGIREHYISTTLLAAAVFLFTLKCSGSDCFIASIGRKYSSWIYILHPILITCFGTITQKMGVFKVYSYVAPIVVYTAATGLIMIVDLCRKGILTKKIKKF